MISTSGFDCSVTFPLTKKATMTRFNYVVCLALFASVPACVTLGEEEDVVLASDESEARRTTPQPTENPVTLGGGNFIDACIQPGATRAVFNPTSSFDATDEGVTAALDLPFAFRLYGTTHSKFWITPNGQLGFGATPGGSAFGQVACPLPNAALTKPTLLIYSADLVGRIDDPNAGVCFATVGTAPYRKLVVTWKDSFFYEAWLTSNVTFSAILNEGTNVADVAIDRVDAPTLPSYETGYGAVLGRQAGGSGYAYSCSQPRAPEGTIIHYSP
jgi:hypothetical protein